MKTIKSLILGSAAGLLAVGGHRRLIFRSRPKRSNT
jgi:hypothetical protein